MHKAKLIYLLVVHLMLVLLLIHTVSTYDPNSLAETNSDEQPLKSSMHYLKMLQYHERKDKAVPAGSVIFIGDSNLQGLYVSAVANPSVNYGIGRDTAFGVLSRLPQYESIKQARAVVISVGTNDLKTTSNDEILANYDKIIATIPPHVPVIINAIFPVGKERQLLPGKQDMPAINKLNAGLKERASQSDEVYFVDAGRLMMDKDNEALDDRFHVGDGIHLNSEGQAIWIKELHAALAGI